jgi:hypothetical protein
LLRPARASQQRRGFINFHQPTTPSEPGKEVTVLLMNATTALPQDLTSQLLDNNSGNSRRIRAAH